MPTPQNVIDNMAKIQGTPAPNNSLPPLPSVEPVGGTKATTLGASTATPAWKNFSATDPLATTGGMRNGQ